jgi:ribosomal-protein-alanine N-acetyltransferase
MENNKLEIRLGLKEEYLPLLAEAEKACFSDPWPMEAFQSEMCDPYFYLLAFEGDELVGYAGGMSLYETCDLNNIAVLPQHRRRGIAAVLLESFMAEARARGAEQMLLEVRESNIPAIRLYERYGFTAYNKRKNYYRNPAEDAVLMVVTLC